MSEPDFVMLNMQASTLYDSWHSSDYAAIFVRKRYLTDEPFVLVAGVEVKVIIIFPERFHEFFS